MPFKTRGTKRYGSVKRRGLNLGLWKNRPAGKSVNVSTSSPARSLLAVECSEETRKELAALVAGQVKKRATKKPKESGFRQEIRKMHAAVRSLCQRGGYEAGSEPYSVLCSLGAAMGLPKIGKSTFHKVAAKYHAVMVRS